MANCASIMPSGTNSCLCLRFGHGFASQAKGPAGNPRLVARPECRECGLHGGVAARMRSVKFVLFRTRAPVMPRIPRPVAPGLALAACLLATLPAAAGPLRYAESPAELSVATVSDRAVRIALAP